MSSKNNTEIFDALDLLEKERGVGGEELIESIKTGIVQAVMKNYNVEAANVKVTLDVAAKKYEVCLLREIVEEVTNPHTQISLAEALTKNRTAKVGNVLSIKLDTKQIGRISAGTGKNQIHQGINEAVKRKMAIQYQNKQHEVVDAEVVRMDAANLNAFVVIDKHEFPLYASEQLPNDRLKVGDHIKVYIHEVIEGDRRCSVKITRMSKELVKRLLEKEIPEVFNGEVEIKSIARDPGSRTKVAVWSNDPNIDAVGSCIGQKGMRIGAIVEELRGEKIDVIRYSETPEEYIAQALSPAEVESVEILSPETRACRVIVPDTQLSLAIGNKGQNAKLAAKLTGYKIDIKSRALLKQEEERLAAQRLAEEQAASEEAPAADAASENEQA